MLNAVQWLYRIVGYHFNGAVELLHGVQHDSRF